MQLLQQDGEELAQLTPASYPSPLQKKIRTISVRTALLPYAIQAVASLDCIGEAQRHTHKVWSLHCEGKVTKCDNRQSSGFASLLWAATFGASPAVEALQ